MLSEISQIEKNMYYMVSPIWGKEKRKKKAQNKTETDS